MYNIKTLNNISSKGLERLSSNLFAVDEEGAQPDGILVRSAAMQDMEMCIRDRSRFVCMHTAETPSRTNRAGTSSWRSSFKGRNMTGWCETIALHPTARASRTVAGVMSSAHSTPVTSCAQRTKTPTLSQLSAICAGAMLSR